MRYWAIWWVIMVFVYNYKHLCRIKRIRRAFGFVCVYEIEAICGYYWLYYASVMHEVTILCISGVDLGVFVC